MVERTIDHLYNTYEEAVQVVADLTAAGVPATDISLIEGENDARLPRDVVADSAQNPAGTGATLGAAIGAGIGVLEGVGAISLPFLTPLTTAGWIVPTLVLAGIGAAIGAAIGAVTKLGVTNTKAHSLAAGLQRGQHLVMAKVPEDMAAQAQAIMAAKRDLPPDYPTPEPDYDMEYVADHRSVAQERAAIHRQERELDREGDV